MSATLGIATVAYLPYAFFNIIDLLITFLFAILDIKIARTGPEVTFPVAPEETTWRDIGGQRVEGTEYEKDVIKG